jgi:hypothetical protein
MSPCSSPASCLLISPWPSSSDPVSQRILPEHQAWRAGTRRDPAPSLGSPSASRPRGRGRPGPVVRADQNSESGRRRSCIKSRRRTPRPARSLAGQRAYSPVSPSLADLMPRTPEQGPRPVVLGPRRHRSPSAKAPGLLARDAEANQQGEDPRRQPERPVPGHPAASRPGSHPRCRSDAVGPGPRGPAGASGRPQRSPALSSGSPGAARPSSRLGIGDRPTTPA